MEVDKHEILITAAPTDSCWGTQYPTAMELDASSIKVEAFSDGKRVYSKTLPLNPVPPMPDFENPYWVTWQDAGRSIETEIDGKIYSGILNVMDTWIIDDEEIPMFNIILDDDTEIPFDAQGKWRFTD